MQRFTRDKAAIGYVPPMTCIWVSLVDLAAGDLPPICAKTGVRCRTTCRVRFSNRPSWTTWLLPYSWYTDAAAGRFTHRAVLGILPMTPRARRRVMSALGAGQLARRVGVGLLLAAFVVALASPGGLLAKQLAAAGAGSLIAAVALKVLGYGWSVGGRIEKGDRWVRLTGVHPRFVAAVRAHYRARRVARIAATQPSPTTADGLVKKPTPAGVSAVQA